MNTIPARQGSGKRLRIASERIHAIRTPSKTVALARLVSDLTLALFRLAIGAGSNQGFAPGYPSTLRRVLTARRSVNRRAGGGSRHLGLGDRGIHALEPEAVSSQNARKACARAHANAMIPT